MLSTQKEEHQMEMEELKDGFAKKMEQLEVNVWVGRHSFKLMRKFQN
jgi:hypothetical protein